MRPRAVPPHPTVRQLAGDAWGELVGWDGRLAQTIRTLLRRPGELTRALLEGQRTRYVSPVRLYLTCSLLYFVLAAATPIPDVEFEVGVGIGASDAEQEPGEDAFARAVASGLDAITPEDRLAAETYIASQPRLLQPMLRALAMDYPGVRRRVTETMPRALFVLIPALAAILGVVPSRTPVSGSPLFRGDDGARR